MKNITRYSILLVDDDAMVRTLMRHALHDLDLHVIEAASAEEALNCFERERPAITLLDVGLPAMDGFDCCDHLRKLPGGSECAIVMVTSLDRPEDIERAFEAGATDFMTKPLSWRLFNHRIRYILKANKALQELKSNQQKLAKAHAIAGLGYWEWDFHSPSIDISPELLRLAHLPNPCAPLRYSRVLRQVHPRDRKLLKSSVRSALAGRPYDIEYRVVLKTGKTLTVSDKTEIVLQDGKPHIIGTVLDITGRKKSEKRISYYAFNDLLTNLPNRRAFIEQCKVAIETARETNSRLTLLFLDLDRFKHVNDTYGHRIGDKLLHEAANRIKRSFRNTGSKGAIPSSIVSNIARLGGDEFTLLLCGNEASDNASGIAQRLLQQCETPFFIDDCQIYISASVGIAVFPQDGRNVETLLQHADIAMYHAKQMGCNNFQFFSSKLSASHVAMLNIEADMRKALERREFELHFQPQLDGNGGIEGFEALLRWRHPQRGLLAPASFIGVAENSGLIIPIGTWVLHEACRQATAWKGPGNTRYSVAINLSAHQFNLSTLPRQVGEALARSGLPPHLLELEITESALVEDVGEAIQLLKQLRHIGVRIAIDDFGTGYSSLNYLKKFPIDILKVDKSFIDEIAGSRKDAAILQSILQLASNLGICAVAEGVERIEQLEVLRAMGCDRFQGYLFAPPMPAGEIADYCRSSTPCLSVNG